ncbi:hypothetical protein HN865_01550 [Candidatus Woesearchaeota archaeon]|jgi:hypothetical protein|nr:hypothetical protein [Candidatus Woesearchaeota archaeon]MBT7237522.1 hypothetical protein [Candidatus Woesearchaeota archaeon]
MSDTKATLRAELLKRIRRAGFDILELKTECLTQIDSAEMYGTEDDSEEIEEMKDGYDSFAKFFDVIERIFEELNGRIKNESV